MSSQDRRNAPRYAPASEEAQVGWWDGPHFRTTPARLNDISVGGAALSLEGQGPVTSSVWVCLVGAGPSGWIAAGVAAVVTAEGGTPTFRVAFADSCPYEAFRAAAWGGPVARAAPPPEAKPAEVAPADPRKSEPAASPATGTARASVVTPEPLFQPPPTLADAQLAGRASRDRVASLTWAVALAMSLTVAAIVAVVASGKMGSLQIVERTITAVRR